MLRSLSAFEKDIFIVVVIIFDLIAFFSKSKSLRRAVFDKGIDKPGTTI